MNNIIKTIIVVILVIGFLLFKFNTMSFYDYIDCEAGNVTACSNIAHIYETVGKNGDFLKAIEYYNKSCEIGGATECVRLGFFYHLKNDNLKAIEYYTKGCEIGNGKACSDLGSLYEHKNGENKDYLKTRKYYEKGCDLRDGTACLRLGYLYATGKGVKQDSLKEIEYYSKGCELEDNTACYHLGYIYIYRWRQSKTRLLKS